MAEPEFDADQCRIGRAALGWTREEVAMATGVAIRDLEALEEGHVGAAATGAKVAAAFAEAGVTFHFAPDGSVRMRARTLDGIIETPIALSPRRPR